jgi:hypothetical protein
VGGFAIVLAVGFIVIGKRLESDLCLGCVCMIVCCGPGMAYVDHHSKQLVHVDSLITVLAIESTPYTQASVCGYISQPSC